MNLSIAWCNRKEGTSINNHCTITHYKIKSIVVEAWLQCSNSIFLHVTLKIELCCMTSDSRLPSYMKLNYVLGNITKLLKP